MTGELVEADQALMDRRRWWIIAGTCGLLLLIPQVMLVAVFAARHWRGAILTPVLVVEGATLGGVVIVVALFRSTKALRVSPLLGVDRTTRRAVSRAIQRGSAVDDAALAPLAVESAAFLRRRWWIPVLWAGAALCQLPNVIGGHQPLSRTIASIALGLLTINTVYWCWLISRATKAERANRELVSGQPAPGG